jgi:hypothetical protein
MSKEITLREAARHRFLVIAEERILLSSCVKSKRVIFIAAATARWPRAADHQRLFVY